MSTPVFAIRSRIFRHVQVSRRAKLVAMSILASTCFCIATAFFVGCTTTPKVKLPEVIGEDPTNSELLDAVNGNSKKIESIYASSASLGVEGESGWVKSQIFFERPEKLRLRGSAPLIGNAIDCGCDGEKFWYWSHFTNPDELYYCRLDQYQNSSFSDLLPLDPTWFPELFGVVEIKESDVVKGPTVRDDGKIELVCKEERKDGLYYKRYFFEPKTAAIVRQDVQSNGETILSVETKDFQLVDDVVLPKKLEIFAPSFGRKLYVDLESATLNDSSKFSSITFTQPTDLAAKSTDLASMSTPKVGAQSASNTTGANETAPSTLPVQQPSVIQGAGQPIDASKLPQSQKGVFSQNEVEQFPSAEQIRQNADANSISAVSVPVQTETVVSSETRALPPSGVQPQPTYAQPNVAPQATSPQVAAARPDVVNVPQTAFVASAPNASVPTASPVVASPTAAASVPQNRLAQSNAATQPSFVAPQVGSNATQVPQTSQVQAPRRQTRQAQIYPGFTPEEQAQVPQTAASTQAYALPQSTYPNASTTGQFVAPQTFAAPQTTIQQTQVPQTLAPQTLQPNAWTNVETPQATGFQDNELLLEDEFVAPEPEPIGNDFPELSF